MINDDLMLNSFNAIPKAGRKEMIELIMEDIKNNNYFKSEKYKKLEEEITKMVNIEGVYHDPWHYKDVLTAKEKKDFGLNTRKKISREFLEFISEKGLTMSEPENLLWRIYSKYDKIIYEKYDTIETKQIGNKTIIGSSTLLEHFNE